jgi:hypothetical protein
MEVAASSHGHVVYMIWAYDLLTLISSMDRGCAD